MEMVWHNDEFMEEVSTPAIMVESLNQQLRPAFITKQRTSSPSLGGNEVGLLVMGGMLSRGSQRRTSGAKAPLFRSRTARLKARPFKHPSLPYSAPEGAPFQNIPTSALRAQLKPGATLLATPCSLSTPRSSSQNL